MAFSYGRRIGALGIAAAMLGCRGPAADDRDEMLARADAARLVGAWHITMLLDHPLMITYTPPDSTKPTTGSIAFTENRRGEREIADFGVATHRGASDLDLHGFALPIGGSDRDQVVVARTAPVRAAGTGALDSVFVLLRSDDGQTSVSLAGVLEGDTIRGRWTAQHLRNGADGRFTMSREAAGR